MNNITTRRKKSKNEVNNSNTSKNTRRRGEKPARGRQGTNHYAWTRKGNMEGRPKQDQTLPTCPGTHLTRGYTRHDARVRLSCVREEEAEEEEKEVVVMVVLVEQRTMEEREKKKGRSNGIRRIGEESYGKRVVRIREKTKKKWKGRKDESQDENEKQKPEGLARKDNERNKKKTE